MSPMLTVCQPERKRTTGRFDGVFSSAPAGNRPGNVAAAKAPAEVASTWRRESRSGDVELSAEVFVCVRGMTVAVSCVLKFEQVVNG